MNKPVIAANKPVKVALEKDVQYYFCACGLSANQPYCDGKHKATDIVPKKFTATESGDAFLCQCKYSANTPYCDGSHKQFPADENLQ